MIVDKVYDDANVLKTLKCICWLVNWGIKLLIMWYIYYSWAATWYARNKVKSKVYWTWTSEGETRKQVSILGGRPIGRSTLARSVWRRDTIFIIMHIYTTGRYSGSNYELTWLFYLTNSQQISNGNFITSQIWFIFQPHIFKEFQSPFQSSFTFGNFCFIWWFTFQLRH